MVTNSWFSFYCTYIFNGVHVSSKPCLSSPHVSSASIQSFQYAQLTLYCAVYAHWLCHISHTHQSTYIIYISVVCVTSVVEVCEVLKFALCGWVSLHVWDDHTLEVRYSLSMTAAVSSPCATLSSPSILKNCSVALLGLGLGLALRLRLQLGLGSVLVYTVRVRLGVNGFALKLKGKRHRAFLWKIETRLLSTPPLMSFPHAIDMYLSSGCGSNYVNKGGKYNIKWSISSTTITVCTM